MQKNTFQYVSLRNNFYWSSLDVCMLNPFYIGTLADSVVPDQMPHYSAIWSWTALFALEVMFEENDIK